MGDSRTALRAGQPLWLPARLDQHKPEYSSLSGSHESDVVIVGGGVTGALTALRFAEAGVGVILLEANRIGRGSSAASSALLSGWRRRAGRSRRGRS
jgi:NADPH-dependent 2,4-dienoyl-CoA reductase/sulfur reductase-like enzyme